MVFNRRPAAYHVCRRPATGCAREGSLQADDDSGERFCPKPTQSLRRPKPESAPMPSKEPELKIQKSDAASIRHKNPPHRQN